MEKIKKQKRNNVEKSDLTQRRREGMMDLDHLLLTFLLFSIGTYQIDVTQNGIEAECKIVNATHPYYEKIRPSSTWAKQKEKITAS